MKIIRQPMPKRSLLAQIHILKKELGLTDDQYRVMLGAFGAPVGLNGEPSSKGFTDLQAEKFIGVLQRQKSGKQRAGRHGWGKNKYEYLRPRRGDMADPKQLRKIEAMWRDIARNADDAALESFVERQTGIKKMIWLKKEHAKAVLTALKNMKRKTEKDG